MHALLIRPYSFAPTRTQAKELQLALQQVLQDLPVVVRMGKARRVAPVKRRCEEKV